MTTATGTRWPTALHEAVEYERDCTYAVGWHAGYIAALVYVATGAAELDDAWRPVGRLSQDQRVADRLAEMERHAAQLAERMGRPAGYAYRGGSVPCWGADKRETA